MLDKLTSLISKQGVIVVLLVFLFCVSVGSLFFVANSKIIGREFSPDLFQQREFTYWRFPGTKICIWATKLGTPASPCTKYILNSLKTSARLPEWQVLDVSRGSVTEQRGPSVLYSYLTSKNPNGDNHWDDWSFRNPNLASVLWPIVQQAALQDLYFCIPELMRSAEGGLNPAELNKELKILCLQALAQKSTLSSSENLRNWATDFAADLINDEDIAKLLSSFD